MSAFRRRLIMMQSSPLITDWDYEWSYLSGQLPQDERFIESMTDNIYLTEEGLKFDGKNTKMELVDHDKILFYMKLISEYRTGNSSRGFNIIFHGKTNDIEKEALFNGLDNRFYSVAETSNTTFGTFEFGELLDFTLYCDFMDLNNCYVDYKGKRTHSPNSKIYWLSHKSVISTDNGYFGSEGYVLVKELKFKAYE